jgi:repressor LexA
VEGITTRKTGSAGVGIVSIPILGAADCGPASIFADQNVEGYLRVSSKLIKSSEGLYALRAVGHSMNRADIEGRALESGDYAIVDSKVRAPQTNDYVVSVIDGVCNIKRFVRDEVNQQIVLLSDATTDYPPIYIHPDEVNYFVCGRVVRVIKAPPGGHSLQD